VSRSRKRWCSRGCTWSQALARRCPPSFRGCVNRACQTLSTKGFVCLLPNVTPFLPQVFFPFLELIAKVPETELAEEVFQFVGTA